MKTYISSLITASLFFSMLLFVQCTSEKDKGITLVVLDPGHFHAALVQKTSYENVNNDVFVYAPEGNEVNDYLNKIKSFNDRPNDPTRWNLNTYLGDDFLDKMLNDKKGNVVVLAGNNKNKTQYIMESIRAGYNVLADKPMSINSENYSTLKEAFKLAEEKGLLLYDIMTERFEITTILQKEFSQISKLFGPLSKGSAENPAIIKESVHHFFKNVAGSPLIRPAWFFDVEQEGNGIVDVTTHLVDLIQWECFPEKVIDINHIDVYASNRWATILSKEQFKTATGLDSYPSYLHKDIKEDSLYVYANGEFNYTINGIHAQVIVKWDFEAPAGTGDTHYSIMRGEKCNLIIRQGAKENYQPVLYIEPVEGTDLALFKSNLEEAFNIIQKNYPGISLKEQDECWKVEVPQEYKVGHEAHFGEVTKNYLSYLEKGKLPHWEVPNMIAKYYTTAKALEMAINK